MIDPNVDQLLKSTAYKKTKEYLLAHPEYRPGIFSLLRLSWYHHQLKRGYSVAAIIGHKEFFGLDFIVNRHTLIPRPDTETLVEQVLETIKNIEPQQKITLIDIGTGTSCIPISTLKNTNKQIRAIATDISRSALKVAKKNAAFHSVKIKFFHGDLLSPILQSEILNLQFPIILTANLPYLTTEQFNSEASIHREPYNALVADNHDGLSLYKKLFIQIRSLLLIVNCYLLIVLEIDPRQSEKIGELVKNIFPNASFGIKKDLAGRDRVVCIKLNN